MRRHAELRTVSREEPLRSVKIESPQKGEVARSEETRSLVSTLGDMERMIDEAFHRPFGMNWSPFRQLFREAGNFGEFLPSVDVYEEGGNIVVKSELPGLKRDDIDVKLVNNTIVISGEKKWEEKVERKDFLRVERSHGSFNRTLALPEGLDVDRAKASYVDGILEVRIPKVEGGSSVHKVVVE